MTYSNARFDWLNDNSRTFLSRGYIKNNVTPEQRIRQITDNAEKILGIRNYSNKLYDYVSKGWVSFASPIWSNFGIRGLPVSCFGSYVDDSIESMLTKGAEAGVMTKMGGGTSQYWGSVRGRGEPISSGGTADGPVHYINITNTIVNRVRQSDTRRGACAVYLPIYHPDIEDFLLIKQEGHPIQYLQFGICIPDWWMDDMIDGNMEYRRIWAKVLQKKTESGFPYLIFIDNANINAPQMYHDLGRSVKASNLCTEIFLHSSEDESFVCVLSSLNLLHYEEWKNTDLVETMIYFLDAVCTEFIEKAKHINYMQPAVKFAINEKALGLGLLGWQSLLQSRGIPVESVQARAYNRIIFRDFERQSKEASEKMYHEGRYARLMEGYGKAHSTTNAIAPTVSSSFILGQVSPGISIRTSNYFYEDRAKMSIVYKNPYLMELLEEKGHNNREVWDSILRHDGSVQHLEILSKEEKDIFKTAMEISQMELLIQNSERQEYIDQGISFNVHIHPNMPTKDLNSLYIEAWKRGLKSIYYQKNINASQDLARSLDCVACDG